MAITDASTSLTATWTEKTTVSFNAGTLAGVDECVTEVTSKLKRGTLSATSAPTLAEVKTWLVRAKQELAETKGYTWRRRYASVTLVAGTYRYALPPDFAGGRVAVKDISNDRYITLWPEYRFDSTFPDPSEESNDEPTVGTIKNNELWLCAPPSGGYTLELDYDRSGADNTPTDFSWLPEIERFRCCDYALAEAFESIHQFNVSDRYMGKWNMGIGKARRADGKRRWRSMNFQATSWQADHDRKNYQG